jgi:predicted glycosyltransferase involved in capsule biosynthesis
MKFCCIIPFKYSGERFFALQRVLENSKGLGCDVIVVEQGAEPVLPAKNVLTDQRHIFLTNEFPFNKSWGFNVAWKQVDHEIVVFVDADNLIDSRHIQTCVAEFGDYDFISPHRKLIDLSEDENHLDFARIFAIDRPGRGELDKQKLPLCGAVTMFKTAALERIGGWPEEFFGWGGEDDAMSDKVQKLLKWQERDFNCYHLPHPKELPNKEWYDRNLEILDLYMDLDAEGHAAHADQVRAVIGDRNRKFW